jgi:hypothetical protein
VKQVSKNITGFFSLRVSKFLEKFGYVKVANKDRSLKHITDSDVLQSLIFNSLMNGIEMKSPAKAEHLQDLARGIVFNLKKLKALSLSDFLKTVEQPIFQDRQITFAIGAGIASYWEVQVKLLAQQVGIDIYEENVRPKAKSPSIKDIEPIVEEIKKKFPKIDFCFGRLLNLRNAIVHGNFHQIRSMASESRSNEVKTSFKGNVMMANIANVTESIFLSEEKELETIKRVGLFGWFLDTGNSNLFEAIIQEFQAACFLVNAIVHLKSLSFQETANFYEKLCINGQRPTTEERAQFINARKIFDKPTGLIENQVKTVEKALRK